MQTFEPNSVISVMLISTIDYYGCIPLSVDLTLAEGHKCGRRQTKLVGLIFSQGFFGLTGINFIVMLKQFKLNIMILF